MQYTSYADLLSQNPEALANLKAIFGDQTYTDDNEVCDPDKDGDSQTVAVLACNENYLEVYLKDGFEPAENSPSHRIRIR